MTEKNHDDNETKNDKSSKCSVGTPCFLQRIRTKYYFLKQIIPKYFHAYTGHDPECISSFDNFVKFMHKPTDAAAIGVGRMLFGNFLLFLRFFVQIFHLFIRFNDVNRHP